MLKLVFYSALCYNIDMFVDFLQFFNKGEKIAVAVSGGKDSMCLLHSLCAHSHQLGVSVLALNVEHGIRGDASKDDTEFVKKYCQDNQIPFIGYTVDALEYSKINKTSIEEGARALRYQCFYDAIKEGKCDKVCTAHHQSDNAESILFNLFRGTGVKGATGIEKNVDDKIIRPLLSISKEQIDEYVQKNAIPFVTDLTNYDDDYTRNYLRINVIPKIKEIFPDFEKSLARFGEIVTKDQEYLCSLVDDYLKQEGGAYYITLPCPNPIFSRACITALKGLGVEKDWEKAHIDAVFSLIDSQNGASVNLPKGVVAVREYQRITLYTPTKIQTPSIPFSLGKHKLSGNEIQITQVDKPSDEILKQGFYADLDKIPQTAVIRYPLQGDEFTKFGGGTKKLCDYFTDVKIPRRLRDTLPVLADGNTVLAIFGHAISQKIKIEQSTTRIVKLI